MRRQMLGIFVLAAVLVVTSFVDTGLGAPSYPLGKLLGRAETVLVVRLASRTKTNAVFEVTKVLRGNAKLQKLSLNHTRAGRGLPKNTRGLLLFSQGDNYWGKPKNSFQVGQPIKGQAGYRGWILMDGPGQSKEELERLKELVRQSPYKPDLHGSRVVAESKASAKGVSAGAAKNDVSWGKAVKGLQLGIRLFRSRYGVDDAFVASEIILRNVSDKPLSVVSAKVATAKRLIHNRRVVSKVLPQRSSTKNYREKNLLKAGQSVSVRDRAALSDYLFSTGDGYRLQVEYEVTREPGMALSWTGKLVAEAPFSIQDRGVTWGKDAGPLRAGVILSPMEYGQPVRITAVVRNGSDEPVTVRTSAPKGKNPLLYFWKFIGKDADGKVLPKVGLGYPPGSKNQAPVSITIPAWRCIIVHDEIPADIVYAWINDPRFPGVRKFRLEARFAGHKVRGKEGWSGQVSAETDAPMTVTPWGKEAGGLMTRVRLDKPRYRVGQGVHIAVDALNTTDKAIVVGMQGNLGVGIQVTDADGKAVKKLREQKRGGIASRALKAHEQTTLAGHDLALQYDLSRPGRYRVRYVGTEGNFGWLTPLPGGNAVEFEIAAGGADLRRGAAGTLQGKAGERPSGLARVSGSISTSKGPPKWPLPEVRAEDASVGYIQRECLPILNRLLDSLLANKDKFPELAQLERRHIKKPFDPFLYQFRVTPVQKAMRVEPGGCSIALFLERFSRTKTGREGLYSTTASHSKAYPCKEFDGLSIRFNYEFRLGTPNQDLQDLLNTVLKQALRELAKKEEAFRARAKRASQKPDRTNPGAGHADRKAPLAGKAGSVGVPEKAWPTKIPPHPPATAEDIQRFLAALKAQMPDNWAATPPRTGKVRPTHWAEGRGTVIRLATKGYRPVDWKRGKGGEVLVWIMSEAYTAKRPSAVGAQVGPARELGRWCQRRVLVWGSGGDDWRDWERAVHNAHKASWRAAVLLRKIETFTLRVQFRLVPKTPDRTMVLSVAPAPAGARAHTLHAVISKAQARKIITYLTAETFLSRALDSRESALLSALSSIRAIAGPRCFVSVRTSEYACGLALGWGPPMLGRLAALRKVLEGDAAKEMDQLLGGLKEQRKQWQRVREAVDQLAVKSDLVVWGTVTAVHDYRPRDGGMGYDVDVGKVLKGNHAGKALRFRSAGQVAYAEYTKGEPVLLFLAHGSRQGELLQLKPATYLAELHRHRSIPAGGVGLWAIQTYLDRLGTKSRARAEPAGKALSVSLSTWNSSVTVLSGRLDKSWLQRKPGDNTNRMSPGSFDRHQASGALTPQQEAALWQWARKHEKAIFALRPEYRAEGERYSTTFGIRIGNRGHSVTCRGPSQPETLRKAIAEFRAIVKQVKVESTHVGVKALPDTPENRAAVKAHHEVSRTRNFMLYGFKVDVTPEGRHWPVMANVGTVNSRFDEVKKIEKDISALIHKRLKDLRKNDIVTPAKCRVIEKEIRDAVNTRFQGEPVWHVYLQLAIK